MMPVDPRRYAGSCVVGFAVSALGLAAFACCVSAEFRKAEEKHVELDGTLCSLPRMPAFELGIVAILCISVAQFVGTSASSCLSRGRRIAAASFALQGLSWLAFGSGLILVGTAASMNKGQIYGEGWLDGECYVVKHGVFAAAGVLDLATVACMLVLVYMAKRAAPPPPPTSEDLAKETDREDRNSQREEL